jgi:hypothetical protein
MKNSIPVKVVYIVIISLHNDTEELEDVL